MKKTIRLVSLLLALLLCAAIVVSCGDAGKTPDTTPAASTEKPVDPANTEPAFPAADYKGETFTVYAREDSTYSHTGIYAEEQTGDAVNDQALARNRKVEDKYKMVFALKTASNPISTLEADLKGDAVDYDLILARRYDMKNAITSGFLADWHNTNIDFDNTWWDANCAAGYDINGKLYMAANDVSVSNMTGARFLYFNKKLVENYHLENPYTLVEGKEWVLDKFIEMVKAISNPSDDPTQLGVFGMLRETGASNGNHMHLITGCDVHLVKWEDGKMASNIDASTITKLQDITDKLQTVLTADYTKTYDEVDKIDTSTGDLNKFNKGRRNFAEGHFLFVQNGMGVADQFLDMTDGLGVVPNPKYTADQERYFHMVDKYALIWAIPNSKSVDLDRLSVVTDYWAYASTSTVMATFYEVVTKGKRTQDPKANANLDIIKGSICYEIGFIFDLGLDSSVNEGYTGKNMSSKFANTEAMNAKMRKVNDALAALE